MPKIVYIMPRLLGAGHKAMTDVITVWRLSVTYVGP